MMNPVEALKTVAPIPTVVPGNTPIYQTASDTGSRTLWYYFSKS